MQLIKMTGGLGNQMFIYAFYLQMKKRFPDIRIDLSDMMHYHVHHGYEMNHVFNLPKDEFCIPQTLKKVLEFLFFKTLIERKLKNPFEQYKQRPLWPLVYYKGFYQSERYFEEIQDKVRQAFTFNESLINAQSKAMLRQLATDENSVSIHIRRGDYLQAKHWATTGCICQLPYYHNAIAEIKQRIKEPHFYVFSDDLEWVKENLSLDHATYIDWNTGADSWQDMMLMSHCRNHIICNSTFSWWGAWLNPNPQKAVVMPEKWFVNTPTPHIFPKGWIKAKIQ